MLNNVDINDDQDLTNSDQSTDLVILSTIDVKFDKIPIQDFYRDSYYFDISQLHFDITQFSDDIFCMKFYGESPEYFLKNSSSCPFSLYRSQKFVFKPKAELSYAHDVLLEAEDQLLYHICEKINFDTLYVNVDFNSKFLTISFLCNQAKDQLVNMQPKYANISHKTKSYEKMYKIYVNTTHYQDSDYRHHLSFHITHFSIQSLSSHDLCREESSASHYYIFIDVMFNGDIFHYIKNFNLNQIYSVYQEEIKYDIQPGNTDIEEEIKMIGLDGAEPRKPEIDIGMSNEAYAEADKLLYIYIPSTHIKEVKINCQFERLYIDETH